MTAFAKTLVINAFGRTDFISTFRTLVMSMKLFFRLLKNKRARA